MKRKNPKELIEIFNSNNFLSILENNISDFNKKNDFQDFKLALNQLSKKISEFKGSVELYLLDKRGVELFLIDYSWISEHFRIEKIFNINLKKNGDEVLKYLPLNSENIQFYSNNRITVNHNVFYNGNEIAFEIRLWTLVIDKLKLKILEKNCFYGKYDEFDLITNLNEKFNEWTFINKKNNKDYVIWRLMHISYNKKQNGFIYYKGMAESCIRRELYAEFYFTANFNLKSGDLEIIKYYFDTHNYK